MKIGVIFDTQVKPDIDLNYLRWIGEYFVEKQPDVWVHIGDHWDMPSLSSFDFGKLRYEGRRYKADIEAGNEGMKALLAPLRAYNKKAKENKKKRYTPRRVFCIGNHDQRVERAVQTDPKLDGLIGYKDFDLSGWEVYDYLDPCIINGVAFSHYFPTGVMGRPPTTANAMLNKAHMSCVAGHQQGRQIATAKRVDGKLLTGIICGSSYIHDEEYLGPQGNQHWRGVALLHEVEDGQFDEMFVSMGYLKEKYGN